MLEVERHLFVPKEYQHLAYTDQPLPIGEEQTISQPYIVAYMLQALQIQGNEKVLEIGTGSGYVSALLSHLVREVYTVEIRLSLAEKAKALLQELGIKNVFFLIGDGLQGWPQHAPYDFIFVSCCLKKIPVSFLEQISENGKIIAPLVWGRTQKLVLLEKHAGKIKKKELLEVSFVPALAKN